MTLAELNALPAAAAAATLQQCCGSTRWARLVATSRPFVSLDVLSAAAERIWWTLEAADWLEAFAAHPRIGERGGSSWSTQEQAGAASAEAAVRARLADGNRQYEQRFGYTFIVCATGKTAEEILTILEQRLHNEPADELQIAADEQRKITELRLNKLIAT